MALHSEENMYKYGLERVQIYSTPDAKIALLYDYSADVNVVAERHDYGDVIGTKTHLRNADFKETENMRMKVELINVRKNGI